MVLINRDFSVSKPENPTIQALSELVPDEGLLPDIFLDPCHTFPLLYESSNREKGSFSLVCLKLLSYWVKMPPLGLHVINLT